MKNLAIVWFFFFFTFWIKSAEFEERGKEMTLDDKRALYF